MAHHKRKRPENRRAGCLLCKPWTVHGFAKDRVDAELFSDHHRRCYADRELQEARSASSIYDIQRRPEFSSFIIVTNDD
jgi:hypothetical protein